MHFDEKRLIGEQNTSCGGCGAGYPERGGPVHAYVTASPECWGLFTELLPQVPERMFTDAYMAQHPDGDDPRQVQSVAAHLIALDAVLTSGQPRGKVEDILRAAIELGREEGGHRILDRPGQWSCTIVDVVTERVTSRGYVEEVLASWRQSEPDWLGEWVPRTLRRLYG